MTRAANGGGLLIAVAIVVCIDGAQIAHVPEALLRVAGVDPESFGYYLAAAGVPAGIEVHVKDRRTGRLVPIDADPRRAVSVEELVSAFNGQHQGYYAAVVGGVVVVQPRSDTAVSLDSGMGPGRLLIRGLMPALRELMMRLGWTTRGSGGLPGSVMAPPGSDAGESIQVDVDLADRSLRDILTGMVRQAPGHVWLAVTAPAGDEWIVREVGFIHREWFATMLPVK